MASSTRFCLLALLLCPISLLAQDASRREPMPNFIDGIRRAPQTRDDGRTPFGWRDYLLRKLYPPTAFDRFAEPEMFFPGQGQNDLHRYPNSSPLSLPDSRVFGGVKEAWVNHFRSGLAPGVDYAAAIALDDSGNVYVTGTSYDSPYGADYLTAKYDPGGNLLWTARYNGEGNGFDHAVSIGVDANGNIYVTGTSQGMNEAADMVTIKYNTDGAQQWIARLDDPNNEWINATASILDATGHVYVTGSTSGIAAEIITVKYNSDGGEQWVARYKKARFNLPRMMAVDNSSNVYVAGYSGDEGGRDDFLTVKYNANGLEQWAASYNGPDNQYDLITAMAVDAAGNVYVMGECRGPNEHYAIIKYNQTGIQQWVVRLEPGINRSLTSSALVPDGTGNIYVAAARVNDHDYTVAKYNPNGSPVWAAHYDSPGERRSGIVDLALDPAGNVLVTGMTSGIGTEQDFTTIKYNSTGIQQWVAGYNGTENSYDYVNDFVINQAGQVFVTGSSYEQGTDQDYTTIKYDANGQKQWVAHYNKEGNSNDAPAAMTIDAADTVYVTGRIGGYESGYITTIKYEQDELLNEPRTYNLSQSFPNPFTTATNIRFGLQNPSFVSLKVYTLLGQEVETLVDGLQSAGEYRYQWNPINLPNGVHMYLLQAGDFVETKKLVLLK